MEKEGISQEEKENFLVHSKLFLQEFESVFIVYLSTLWKKYTPEIDDEEVRRLAHLVYQRLFECDDNIKLLKEELLSAMNGNALKVGFLLSRSMLYMIENYIAFCREHQSISYLELLCECIQRFIMVCEEENRPLSSSSFMDFSQNNDVLFSHTNTILEAFRTMQNKDEKIIFLNLYKGVPISSEASIVSIEDESVTFQVDALQAIAIKLDNHAFLVKNDYFAKHMKADVLAYHFHNNTVTLNNFTYLLNMPALQRESIRVHPDIIATVHLHQFNNLQTSGRLYDLSMNGLGVVSGENNGVFVGAKVMIDFELNGMSADRKIEVQGEVINIIEYNDSYRYCMRIFPDRSMSKKILNYITEREKEILEELNEALQEYSI
ncbi:MAG: PilZ domain-containing protein [Epsilonproteobacteria bacterium]|nr:PilZ domain-containing protein [Campylobacterota bacterium]